ncbi:tRNA (N6-isopentenyl adenosine(37)-C2)-methylthiotransferase MiaB [Sulfoacidibacillus thermotolerans]|uniref:tRNA (N6-isopentenyl adenosine(37)-C2)-methylthiotransferase MiaB n=1 Tax=Sulfoacidibacillus thermotolerans TaxID=1765684 RepID=UPI001FE9B75B|nr:tRNA (N6-isopentenyl adenosine(37)-C2)-methylthiotransferase MiaB [Sulfoacidibacillus thermotolerans]
MSHHIDDIGMLAVQVKRPVIEKTDLRALTDAVRPDLVGAYKGKRYMIRTYGCQMNEHDTEVMAGLLEILGYDSTEDEELADLILFNTCAVRENAENKVFGEVGRIRPLKYRNPELLIGVCGCMPQEKAVQAKIRETYPWIDLVFGTHNLHRLPELVEQAYASQETVMEVWDKAQFMLDDLPKVRKEGVRAWVNIQYGCNKFCTYCIVPYTRGRERSRTLTSIVDEVKGLVASGFKEITVLGQNVNDYGIDLGNADFADLLRAIGRVEGIERVRFTTSNPWNFTDRVIAAIAETETVCEHIHLPVQSGSNAVLRKMNRGYTREYYLQLVKKIRAAIPNVALTTDIIVGFPTETEEDFLQTLQLIEEVSYDSAYTFIYSPRTGTPAARLEDPVPLEVKKERLNRLMELQNKISRLHNEQLIGKTLEVLIEGVSKTNPNVLSGRTRTNKIVLLDAPKEAIHQTVFTRIDAAQTWTLRGTLVTSDVETA